MSVRAKRGLWPTTSGNYVIANEATGGTLMAAWGSDFGPDTEAVAERILAAINGDTVPAPTLPEGVTWNAQTYTLAADVPSPLGWEWETRDDGWWPCVAEATRFSRIIRPIGGALAAAPTLPDDLPSWVSMHATATGADLIEHDPNGDLWERWNPWSLGWLRDHCTAAEQTLTYLVRRRSAPVEPTTEKATVTITHRGDAVAWLPDLTDGTWVTDDANPEPWQVDWSDSGGQPVPADHRYVVVVRWADGTVPEAPGGAS